MRLHHPRCAGLDIHQKTIVACVRLQLPGSAVTNQTRTFGTNTADLLALADWLREQGVTHAAMESTGVYWRPIWHVLEDEIDLILANPQHVRQVPGRKTDVNDAQWLAELLAHGLIQASFVPPPAVQELRDLTRTRKQLTREIARHTLRLEKTLEDGNVKLVTVVSDVLGKTGRAILRALIDGEKDAQRLAALADVRIKAGEAQLVAALNGRLTAHHRFILKLHLAQVESLELAVRDVEARLEQALAPFRDTVERLTTMPGISITAARVLMAEIGMDMTRFPTAAHLVSWAGLCPRADQSAGKRRSSRIRHGSPWLKTTLVQAAWAAAKTNDSYLRAQFLRLQSRRGGKKAIIAVASSMLTAAYYIIKDGVDYKDLGADHFNRRDKAKLAKRLVQRLQGLGFSVQVQAVA
jgi:transposase